MKAGDTFEIVRNEVADVLRIPASNLHGTSDFFELGMNSLSIVELVSRLQRIFEIKFSVTDFFRSPCVNAISDMINSKLVETA